MRNSAGWQAPARGVARMRGRSARVAVKGATSWRGLLHGVPRGVSVPRARRSCAAERRCSMRACTRSACRRDSSASVLSAVMQAELTFVALALRPLERLVGGVDGFARGNGARGGGGDVEATAGDLEAHRVFELIDPVSCGLRVELSGAHAMPRRAPVPRGPREDGRGFPNSGSAGCAVGSSGCWGCRAARSPAARAVATAHRPRRGPVPASRRPARARRGARGGAARRRPAVRRRAARGARPPRQARARG